MIYLVFFVIFDHFTCHGFKNFSLNFRNTEKGGKIFCLEKRGLLQDTGKFWKIYGSYRSLWKKLEPIMKGIY
jgi:hypothetical protein